MSNEDSFPTHEAAPMRPEPSIDPADRDTEAPPASTTPTEYDGFPKAPPTGVPGFDVLLAALTELRDAVQANTAQTARALAGVEQVGRDVAHLSSRIDGQATAIERRRVTDEANEKLRNEQVQSLGKEIAGMASQFEAFRTRTDERLARVEDHAEHANGAG